jgi:hypothetical protein
MRRASSRFLSPLAGGLSLLLAPAAAMQPGHPPASTSAVDATGTTIEVTNCNDSGPGSLRAAVTNALDPDTIDLTGLNCYRIGLTSGPIVIPQAVLSLVGPGKNALTIDGNLRGQVIRYENSAGRLRISGMTITRGFKQNDASSPYGGGCIYADYGVLELRNVRVSHCHACGNGARSGRGGGIYANGMVRLFDSEIVGNRATGGIAHGGGIYADGGVLVRNSRVSRNHAPYDGGGIYVNSGLDASRTTFSGNTGGAVTAYGRSVIANSTVTGNRDRAGGGGTVVELSQVGPNAFDTDTMIVNSTISGNTAERHTVSLFAETGAVLNSTIVFNEHRGGTDGSRCTDYATVLLDGGWEGPMHLESTIVTNNTCASNPYHDIGRYEYNTDLVLVGADNLVTSSNMLQLPPDTISLDPRLAPLANNGGRTKTHALLDDSPAIDMGNNAADLAYDQRGPGFPRVNGAQADIGAYER